MVSYYIVYLIRSTRSESTDEQFQLFNVMLQKQWLYNVRFGNVITEILNNTGQSYNVKLPAMPVIVQDSGKFTQVISSPDSNLYYRQHLQTTPINDNCFSLNSKKDIIFLLTWFKASVVQDIVRLIGCSTSEWLTYLVFDCLFCGLLYEQTSSFRLEAICSCQYEEFIYFMCRIRFIAYHYVH